jgi:hypothetical protein
MVVAAVLCLPAPAFAADVKLIILSDPPGATVYEGEDATLKSWGYAPIVLQWQKPRSWKSCLQTRPMRVRWVSGAEVSFPTIALCPAQGKEQQITFMRPTGVDGAEIDAQFGLQVQMLRTQQAIAAAAAEPPPPVSQRPLHCASRLIGSQVFTNCY